MFTVQRESMGAWERGGLFVLLIVLTPTLPCALSPTPANAQPVRAFVTADTVGVGERFTLWLAAEHAAGTQVLFPAADAPVFGDLNVLRRSRVRGRSIEPGRRVDSVAYEVTTFALDTVRVPSLRVGVATERDTVRLATAPFTVPVRSVVPPEAEGLKPLAPPAPFPAPVRWPYVLLAAAALALLGGLGYLLWRRRTAQAPSAAPTASPYEKALQQLGDLTLPSDRADPEAVKAFYTALSNTLRRYLARRLGVAAREHTTHELDVLLRREAVLPEAPRRCVRTALEDADRVKFADHRPAPPAHREALDETRTAIDAVEEAR